MDKDHIKILLIEDDEDDYALVRELLSETWPRGLLSGMGENLPGRP